MTNMDTAERLLREAREKWWAALSATGDPLYLTNNLKSFDAGWNAYLSSIESKESAAGLPILGKLNVDNPADPINKQWGNDSPAPPVQSELPEPEEAMWCQSEQTGNWSWRVSKEAYDALRSLLAQREEELVRLKQSILGLSHPNIKSLLDEHLRLQESKLKDDLIALNFNRAEAAERGLQGEEKRGR